MATRMASVAPAISNFNANMRAGEQERRLAESDYVARENRKRAIGLDEGKRRAFAAAYPDQAPAGMPGVPGAAASPVMPPPSAIGSFVANAPPPPAAPLTSAPTMLAGGVPAAQEITGASSPSAPAALD